MKEILMEKDQEIRSVHLRLLMRLHVTLGETMTVGSTSKGNLKIIPILGGTAEGPRVKARICPGGADWNTMLPDGRNHVFARYWLEAENGEIISVENEGVIDWNRKTGPYLTTPRFACDVSGAYAFLNDGVYTGEIQPGGEGAVNIILWQVMD